MATNNIFDHLGRDKTQLILILRLLFAYQEYTNVIVSSLKGSSDIK